MCLHMKEQSINLPTPFFFSFLFLSQSRNQMEYLMCWQCTEIKLGKAFLSFFSFFARKRGKHQSKSFNQKLFGFFLINIQIELLFYDEKNRILSQPGGTKSFPRCFAMKVNVIVLQAAVHLSHRTNQTVATPVTQLVNTQTGQRLFITSTMSFF